MRIYVHDSEGKRVVEADESASLIEVTGAGIDAQIWVEDADEPLAAAATVGAASDGKVAAVHVGKGQITVTVTYNGLTKTESFGPGTKVEKVFDWVVGPRGLDIDEKDANDLVVRLHGSPADLDPDTHIGTLADKKGNLALDLVPGERFAG